MAWRTLALALAAASVAVDGKDIVPVYRYWLARYTDHFYTTNAGEIGTTTSGQVGKFGYKSEGIGFYLSASPAPGFVPLYRYYLARGADHFYTTNRNEIGTTTPGQTGKFGYKSEGVLGYCSIKKLAGMTPLYRYWKAAGRDHFYTTNANEIGTVRKGAVGRYGYKYEGVQCYVYKEPPKEPVYRYFLGRAVDHFYTTNPAEIGTTTPGQVGKHGYKSEGIGFYLASSSAGGLVPLYRYWLARGADHFYTTNSAEIGTTTPGQVGKFGYRYEGVLGYCSKKKLSNTVPLYRYWLARGADHFYTTNSREIGTTRPGAVGRYGYKSEGIQCYVFTKAFGVDAVDDDAELHADLQAAVDAVDEDMEADFGHEFGADVGADLEDEDDWDVDVGAEEEEEGAAEAEPAEYWEALASFDAPAAETDWALVIPSMLCGAFAMLAAHSAFRYFRSKRL